MKSKYWAVTVGLLVLLSAGLFGCQSQAGGTGVATAMPSPSITATSSGETTGQPVAASARFTSFTEGGDPFQGNPDAPVLVEEFSSYQCPFCALYFRDTYAQLIAAYADSGQIQYVFRDFPLPNQPQSMLAAEAAGCAGETGGADAYWRMHDVLFSNQSVWSGADNAADIFKGYADQVGVDRATFDQCMESHAKQAEIEADAVEGRQRGVSGTPTFFVNGQPMVGAQPFEVFANIIDPLLAGGGAAGAQAPAVPFATPTPAVVVPVDAVRTLGDPAAPVTIVEFSDYQCPFCLRHFNDTLPLIKANLIDTGRVRYEFKDFPLTNIHPQAPKAHAAARCAGEQDAYWPMHDALFVRQTEWATLEDPTPLLKELAVDLGLNTAAFDTCLDSDKWAADVEGEVREGLGLGLSGTPSFFINGFIIVGAREYALFEYAVQLAEQGRLGDAYQPVE